MALTRRRTSKRLDSRNAGGQFQRATLLNTFGCGVKVCPYCRGCNVLERQQPLPGQHFAAPGFADPPERCGQCKRPVAIADWDRELEPPAPVGQVPAGWVTAAQLGERVGVSVEQVELTLRMLGVAESTVHSTEVEPGSRAYSPAVVALVEREIRSRGAGR